MDRFQLTDGMIARVTYKGHDYYPVESYPGPKVAGFDSVLKAMVKRLEDEGCIHIAYCYRVNTLTRAKPKVDKRSHLLVAKAAIKEAAEAGLEPMPFVFALIGFTETEAISNNGPVLLFREPLKHLNEDA